MTNRLTAWRRSPLRWTAFRRLWCALTISRLGDQFMTIALLWLVLQVTGSGVALGVVLTAFALPSIAVAPLWGYLLDQGQPRRIMAIDNLVRALLVATIPALSVYHALHLWQIVLAAGLFGVFAPASQVGLRILLPHLVPDTEIESANALASMTLQFSSLVGPAVAGVIVAAVGAPWALLMDTGSFAILGLVLLTLPDITQELTPAPAAFRERWLGFGALIRLKEVRIITVLGTLFLFAYYPLEPALPLYSQQALLSGPRGYGLLWTAFGVGGVAGLLACAPLVRHRRSGIIFATIYILWGVLLLPLALVRQLPVAMFFLAMAGAAWAPYNVLETSLLQRLVPPPLRGRVFGARLTSVTTAAIIGPAFGGVLLERLSAVSVIGYSALACIVTGVAGLLIPSVRRLRREAAPRADAEREAIHRTAIRQPDRGDG